MNAAPVAIPPFATGAGREGIGTNWLDAGSVGLLPATNTYFTLTGSGTLPPPAAGTNYLNLGNNPSDYAWLDAGPLLSNTVYTLSIAYGQDLTSVDTGQGFIGLINGPDPFGTVLGGTVVDNTGLTPGTFADATVVVTSGYEVSGDLTILMQGVTNGLGLAFANVLLDAAPAADPTGVIPWVSRTNLVLYAGESATLAELPAGQPPFTYQWLSDNGSGGKTFTAIQGATASNYVAQTTASAAAGSVMYEVAVANGSGSSTSPPVTLTIVPGAAPVLIRDTLPGDGAGNGSSDTVGGSVTFSAGFDGSPPLAYQWEKQDTNGNTTVISGATSSTLTLTNLQLSDAAAYFLQASNAFGVLASTPALFKVEPAALAGDLLISTANQFGVGTSNETLFIPTWVIAAGSLIAGEEPSSYDTNGSFTLYDGGGVSALTDGTYGGLYPPATRTVSSSSVPCGQAGSGAGSFVIYKFPTNTYGYNITNIVVYGGHNDAGRDAQAYTVYGASVASPTNFNIPMGKVSYDPTTTIAPSIQSATRVSITSTNSAIAFNVVALEFDFNVAQENGWELYNELQVFGSPAANATMAAPILVQDTTPASAADVVGGQVAFSASFVSGSAVAYQWVVNTGSGPVPVPGATNTTLTLADLQLANSGSYSLQASNGAGVTASTPSTLVVSPVPAPDASGFVVSTAFQTDSGVFTPTWAIAPGSLIAGLAPTATSPSGGHSFAYTSATAFCGGAVVLTDGQFGPLGAGVLSSLASCGVGEAGTFTYALSGPEGGFDLTNIVVYGGWQDGGRDQQAYTVSYATVEDPTNFVALDSVSFLPAGPAQPTATRVGISSPTGAPLATHVAAVEFDFTNPVGENNWEGYAELQLFGSPSTAVTLTNPPVLMTDIAPLDGSDVVGGQVTFTAGFYGAPALTYQWQDGGTNIIGATNATLTLSNLQPSDSGAYSVTASNRYGTATSSANTFTVNPAPSPVNGIIVSPASQNSPGGVPFAPTWDIQAGSLIAGQLPSAVGSGSSTIYDCGPVAALTDGKVGVLDYGNQNTPACGVGALTSVTYTLKGAANGYELTNIVVYGGWDDDGRKAQAYTVSYSTVTAPTNFVPLTSVNYLTPPPGSSGNEANGDPSATRVSITSATVAPLATNVAAVRFDFTTPEGENGWEGYAEIQVFGSPAPDAKGFIVTTDSQTQSGVFTPTWTVEPGSLITGQAPTTAPGGGGTLSFYYGNATVFCGGALVLTDGQIGPIGASVLNNLASLGVGAEKSLTYTLACPAKRLS